MQAGKPEYGLMYDKYLIGLYTGILNNPSKAVEIAQKEIDSRKTPQTYAWYAWALLIIKKRKKHLQYTINMYPANHWKVRNFIIWAN